MIYPALGGLGFRSLCLCFRRWGHRPLPYQQQCFPPTRAGWAPRPSWPTPVTAPQLWSITGLGLRFDCIYSGYLADASQAKLVEQAMDLWPDALTVVDPVMGDHGRMYHGLAPEMVPAMYTLCSRASLILPNTTEAALLLGDPMPGVTGEAELHTAQAQAQRLTRICPRVLITGVAAGRGIACVGADRATGESLVRTPMVPKSFHGTGDIFGAVLVGRLLQGNVLPAAAQAAAVFVADCLKATPDEADERLGVWLESVLPRLMQNPE